ncbi:MAG: NADPH-dependent glutamate synthase [Bdellovibrionota bacterium]|jgi:glutamate synthase (NADPH/NADH) small chain
MDMPQKRDLERQKMPEQDAKERAKNFAEVNIGLSPEAALLESSRCFQCKKAGCMAGCPVGINIPQFIAAIKDNNLKKAADTLFEANLLPGITGRVCAQENQCEAMCIRKAKSDSVAIGYLERYVADWARENYSPTSHIAPSNGKKAAIVGSGPAGLTCAAELARKGYDVTIFEALHVAGGVLTYGIPQFRLPKEIVKDEIQKLCDLGVKIECNVIIGQTYTIDDLLNKEGFDTIFISSGAGLPIFQNIKGEGLKGVYSSNEYLTRANLMRANRGGKTPILKANRVVVIGGGNTAMDSVRTAKRMGAEKAIILYRRSKEEMPARLEEIKHAEQEGIEFIFLAAPLEILGDDQGRVRGIKCQKMQLGEPDSSGRRSPIPIADTEFEIECEIVIEAIGTGANPLLTRATPDLKLNKRGYIEVDENSMTSINGVFAGGDIVRGAATVILAMGDGKNAAKKMDEYCMQQNR